MFGGGAEFGARGGGDGVELGAHGVTDVVADVLPGAAGFDEGDHVAAFQSD